MSKAKRRRLKRPTLHEVFKADKKNLWCVTWYYQGERNRKHFTSKTHAQDKFREVKLAEENQTLNWEALTPAEQIEILQAAKVAKEMNVGLSEAVRNSASLSFGKPIKAKEAAEIYIKHLEEIGVKHFKTYRATVTQFYNHFGDREMDTLDPTEIRTWINSNKLWKAPRTKNNKLNNLATWWRFLKREGFSVGDKNVFAAPSPDDDTKGIARHKIPHKRVDILTVEEAEQVLLEAMQCPYTAVIVVLVLFCGVRVEEACLLTWGDIDLDEEDPTIDVGPEIAKKLKDGKTAERYIPLTDFQVKWIKAAKKKGGLLPVSLNTYQKMKSGNKHFKDVKYKRNGKIQTRSIKAVPARVPTLKGRVNVLRHSFCSYHLCNFENIGKTAHYAGNSPSIIKDAYYNRVKKKVAKRFWDLKPN